MVVYTGKVYNHTINTKDALALSGNIVILSVFYCFVGSMLSYVLYYLFDEYDPNDKRGLEWEKRTTFYQIADVSTEIAIIALVSFWLVFTINTSAPIIPVPTHFAAFVDTYTTGMFFMYSVFIFLSDLTSKLKYLYETHLANRFSRVFPNKGSLLDMSLHYE
jgi:magnesium-transporting ATPase (P-type)